MKKIFVMCVFFILAGVFGVYLFDKYPELKAEKAIERYYKALIKEENEKAFEQLKLYDTHPMGDTKLSNEETLNIFLEKMEFLKKEKYKINKFKIVEVEYQDGHSFWHHIEVDGVINGEPFIIKEVATMVNEKLIIGSSEDPFVDYRNGRMEF